MKVTLIAVCFAFVLLTVLGWLSARRDWRRRVFNAEMRERPTGREPGRESAELLWRSAPPFSLVAVYILAAWAMFAFCIILPATLVWLIGWGASPRWSWLFGAIFGAWMASLFVATRRARRALRKLSTIRG